MNENNEKLIIHIDIQMRKRLNHCVHQCENDLNHCVHGDYEND